MSETKITQAHERGHTTGARELVSDLLHNSPVQAGGMVTTVIAVGQAVAQFNPPLAPYVAFLFSCLLAIYQVRLVQKAAVQECFIIVPIAALILFALALGGNNSIAPTPINASQELDFAKEQLRLKDEALENATQLINELRQIAGLPTNPLHSQKKSFDQSNGELSVSQEALNTPGLFGFLVKPARAQPPDETERQRMLDVWSVYDARQRELQEKQQELEEEHKRLEEEQERLQEERPRQLMPIWRKW